MSIASNVPIEPPSQTQLIDACSELPGVVGGVVPGAGGFDAIALLVHDDETVIRQLKARLKSWNIERSEADQEMNGTVKLLSTKGEMEGARSEPIGAYDDWLV